MGVAILILIGLFAEVQSSARILSNVFVNGEIVPYARQNSYGFQIPALIETPNGGILAFVQAFVRKDGASGHNQSTLQDGNDGWVDIVSRRSIDGGLTWSDLSVVCYGRGANGTAAAHACQQPTPISDFTSGKIFLLMSLDNWHQRLYSSTDDGLTWSSPSDLDAVLRKDGWGLVFNGLPGGIQIRNGSTHAGRLIGCSSAYWSGGELNPDGSIAKQGDHASRFSFSIISDDGGASWRIGSGPVGRFHTTECSISQSFTTDALYMYTRLWDAGTPRRGISKSIDGGATWTNATLHGLPDSAPDCEGSMVSSFDGRHNHTCFYVSSPRSTGRDHLSVQQACVTAQDEDLTEWTWNEPISVFEGESSYSALSMHQGRLLDLFGFSNVSRRSPNACTRDHTCDGKAGVAISLVTAV